MVQVVVHAAFGRGLLMSDKNIKRQIENLPTDEALKVMAEAIAELQKEVARLQGQRNADETKHRAHDSETQ
jgi:hypothetical protein